MNYAVAILAGNVACVSKSDKKAHCSSFQRDNMAINDNVLYASYHVRVKKAISAMTCAALPLAAPKPLTENMVCILLSQINFI